MSKELARKIEVLLQQEIDINRQYLRVLDLERSAVGRAKAEEIEALTRDREGLVQKMSALSKERENIIRETLQIPVPERKRGPETPLPTLREFIKDKCAPADAKRLVAKAEELRSIAALGRQRSSECNQVVEFSLRMVGGLAALVRSATQNVVQSYSPQGKFVEKVNGGAYGKLGKRLA